MSERVFELMQPEVGTGRVEKGLQKEILLSGALDLIQKNYLAMV